MPHQSITWTSVTGRVARLFKRTLGEHSVSEKLGPKSHLVLAKLGFDLRGSYDPLLREPLPDNIQEAVTRLPQEQALRAIPGGGGQGNGQSDPSGSDDKPLV